MIRTSQMTETEPRNPVSPGVRPADPKDLAQDGEEGTREGTKDVGSALMPTTVKRSLRSTMPMAGPVVSD